MYLDTEFRLLHVMYNMYSSIHSFIILKVLCIHIPHSYSLKFISHVLRQFHTHTVYMIAVYILYAVTLSLQCG